MVRASEDARRRVRLAVEFAELLTQDPRKKERLARQECIACFYGSRVGGQAVTDQPCMCCGTNQTYASTATDALCMACAKAGDLCRHCGGDIRMRARRKQWPEPVAPTHPSPRRT